LGKLEIKLVDSPVLRQVAEPVAKVTKRTVKLLRDMEETMYAAKGIGLAAPQIGVSQRLIVIDIGEGPLHLVNPEIIGREGSQIDTEGCLSVPDVWGYVDRSERIVVSALDLHGKPTRLEADGLLARALQHEIDHLDGILFIDKMLEMPSLEST
jgi:peptide deformylase